MPYFFLKKYLVIIYLINVSLYCFADFASDTVYLTWKRCPDTTMTIQWITRLEDPQSQVYYEVPGSLNRQQKIGSSALLPNSKEYLLHQVELTNLTPNTLYQFAISADPLIKPLFFQTMPQELQEPIRFVIGGDMYHDGKTTKDMQKTCHQAVKTNPHFAILGGDIAYAVSGSGLHSEENIDRWIDWIRAWSSCMRTENGRLIPVLSAIGNHDLRGQYNQTPAQAKVFSSLFPMPGERIYNAIDFGQYMSFFIMDSGHANSIDGEQSKWLKEVLQARTKTLHRFAIYHVPAYPSIRNFNNPQSVAIRKYWVPIFEQNGIQMAFEHHDHAYKRTIPLLQGKLNAKGIVYIGDGAWGVDRARPKSKVKKPYLAKFISSRHFILMTIDPLKREMKSIDDSGKVIDEYITYFPSPEKCPIIKKESEGEQILVPMK